LIRELVEFRLSYFDRNLPVYPRVTIFGFQVKASSELYILTGIGGKYVLHY